MGEPEREVRRRPAWLWPAVRIGISLALLIALGMQLNARQIADAMLQVGVGTVALGSATIFAISVPMARRWQLVIAGSGHHLGFVNVWSSMLIGTFFNQVLPTSIGGDVVRGAYAHFAGIPVASAVRTVFIDRLVGLFVLVLGVVPGVAYLLHQQGATLALTSLAVMVAIALLGFVTVCTLDWVSRLLPRSLFVQHGTDWRGQLARVARTLIAISPQIRCLLLERRSLLPILALSILIQGSLFAVIVVFTRSLDQIGVLHILSVVPASMLLSNIPISVAGWGVREAAMVSAMALIGIEAQHAVSVSILFGLAQLVASLPGAIVWWIFHRRLGRGREAQR